jgi:hypothetical protein
MTDKKMTAYFKVFDTILSCRSAKQLLVAEKMIEQYQVVFSVSEEDSYVKILTNTIKRRFKFYTNFYDTQSKHGCVSEPSGSRED